MRFLLTTALVLSAPSWAMADDILARADVSAATVYARGAEFTRALSVDLPAGEHRLIVPMRDLDQLDLLQVHGPEGIEVGLPHPLDAMPVAEGALDTEAEAAARAAVDAADDAVQAARDAIARRNADIRGLETQLAYLNAIARGGQDGAAMPDDPAVLTQLLATLGSETARVGNELQAAQEARRDLDEALRDRQAELEIARQALLDLNPFGTQTQAVAVDLSVPEAGEAVFEISYLNFQASWLPGYVLNLDSRSGALEMERLIHFSYYGEAVMRDVEMRFSTSDPHRARAPSGVYPAPAQINPVAPPAPAVRGGVSALAEAEVMMEPVVMVEDAATRVETNGLSLVYAHQTPVTLGPDGIATLPFDQLEFDMALENRAAPRRDQTAFLIAMGQNDSGEPILPGEALFYRDGDLIGGDYLSLTPDGAELELAFGPLDHLALDWQNLSLDEGDRGVFITENEQRRVVRFSVENTSGEAETVRLLYATPFSEQEDLELEVDLSRAPTERNVDDLRGVHAWDLTLEPGETTEIEMEVELNWPDDQVLSWRP